jgi:hypothetical protein
MGMNKRGMFFTIIAIMIISIFAVSFVLYDKTQNRDSVQKRVSTMNNFILSVEKDIHRQVYISGFRALFILDKRVLETGVFIQNVNASLEELFFNGTINQETQEIMSGATFSDIQDSINLNANKMDVVVSLANPEITIEQTDPWNVRVVLRTDLYMADKEGIASWNKTQSIDAFIPIISFEDPLYPLNTNNLITNNITKTPFTIFVQGSDFTNLTTHALNSFYKESQTAPSFLDRLEGKLSANPQGIESFVNLQKLSDQGIPINEKSVVDYIYFSSQNPSSSHIAGMPGWFIIDNAHKSGYNLS